jgi:hypothetical protein
MWTCSEAGTHWVMLGYSATVGLSGLPESGHSLSSSNTAIFVYRHASKLGCEGIVSKRPGSPYVSGRTRHWLEFKNPAAPAVRRECGALFAQVLVWPAHQNGLTWKKYRARIRVNAIAAARTTRL